MKFNRENFPILLILTLSAIALWQISFMVYTMKWDMMDQFFTCRYFLSDCFHQNILPLWCPYINFGYPFYADPQGGLFYPVTWLFTLAGGYNSRFISIEFLFHIWVAGISFYILLKHFKLERETAIVFALIYCLSGPFISNAQHLSWIISMAWMPLVTLSFLSLLQSPKIQFVLALGLSSFLMLTGGYPAFIIMLCYFLVSILFFHIASVTWHRRSHELPSRIGYLIQAGFIAVVLSAGFLYSLWLVLPLIDRGSSISEVEANSIPFTIQSAVSFFFPFVTASKQYRTFTDISMTNIYGGLFILPFVFLAVFKSKLTSRLQLIFILGLISLFASFGSATPVRTWLYQLLPGMNMFRHASIFRVLALFSFLLVAAHGFDWLIKNLDRLLPAAKKVLVASTVLLGILLIAALLNNSFFYALPSSLSVVDMNLFNEIRTPLTHLQTQITCDLFLLLILTVFWLIKPLKEFRIIALCAVMVIDVMLAAQLNVASTICSTVTTKQFESVLAELPKNFPVPETENLSGISHMGNGVTNPVWFNTSILYKRPSKDGFNNFFLRGLLKYYYDSASMKTIEHPVAYFTSNDALTTDSNIKYRIQKFTPNEIIVDYTANQSARFVLLQSNYPGWKAFCDGSETDIIPFDDFFLSCRASTGHHQLVFTFQPKWIKSLFIFTCVGFCVTLFFTLFFHIKQSRNQF